MFKEFNELRDQMITKSVNHFIDAKITITTLNLKETLQTMYPDIVWDKDFISEWMKDNYQKFNLVKSDNNTFHAPIPSHNKKKSDNRIGRKTALEKMMASNGQFLSTYFVKKNGVLRHFNGKILKDSDTSLGYVKMKSPKGEIRNINLQTLKKLVIGGQEFKIR